MIIALLSHVLVSLLAHWIFRNNHLSTKWDVLGCFDDASISSSTRQHSRAGEEKIVDDFSSCRMSSNSSEETSTSASQFELISSRSSTQEHLPAQVPRGEVNPAFSL
jgi:hypothetical protein